jgi:hypothetical protein
MPQEIKMTQERLAEIDRLIDTTNRVHGLSREEIKMLRALKELQAAYRTKDATTEDAYQRGYEAGKNDEIDRQYEARRAEKAVPVREADAVTAEIAAAMVPEEEPPFGDGGLL